MSNKLPNMLTIQEVARWLNLNPMTIYRMAKKGKIPAVKLEKNWLFPEDALQEWITSQTRHGELGTKKGDDIILKLKRVDFITIPQLQLVYLFGSSSIGQQTPLSDIDIAYLDDGTTSAFDLEPLIEKLILEKHVVSNKIDLVRLNEAPVTVQFKVISKGIFLYKSSEEAQANFEEKVTIKYLDYAPVIDLFYKASYKEVA